MTQLFPFQAQRLPLWVLLFSSACTSSSDTSNPDPAGEQIVERADKEPSVWEFLSAKYDLNNDGQVTGFEYQHDGAEIRILDLDGDGVLTENDFKDELINSAFERSQRAQYSLLEFFQDDDQPYNLTRAECRRAALLYDEDQDGQISKQEFWDQSAARQLNLLAPDWRENPPEVLPRLPWAELLMGIDVNRDRALALAEIDRFFMDNASGREVWNAERYMGFPLKPGFESLSGPRLGEAAPDFTLESTDGGTRVTLSSFKGQRPVALIFGSYT